MLISKTNLTILVTVFLTKFLKQRFWNSSTSKVLTSNFQLSVTYLTNKISVTIMVVDEIVTHF